MENTETKLVNTTSGYTYPGKEMFPIIQHEFGNIFPTKTSEIKFFTCYNTGYS